MGVDVSVICFSKDRPLQLHAYLESIMYCSDIQQKDIAVLYKDSNQIPYDLVKSNFPNVEWVKESDFIVDLQSLVHNAASIVWWGCDDVIFKSRLYLPWCVDAFYADPDMFGFVLRWGLNLAGFSGAWQQSLSSHSADGRMTWDCRKGSTGYAWEVSSSMYRKSDVLDIFDGYVEFEEHTRKKASEANGIEYSLGVRYSFMELCKGPNMLEWAAYRGPLRFLGTRTHMAGFDFSKSVSMSVNRVQEVMPNWTNGRNTDTKTLYDAYVAGKRMDWRSLMGWANLYTHENAARFRLI